VLMCVEHSNAIDDASTAARYSAELLRNWKASQLNEYEQLTRNWEIDTEMAEEVIAASFSNVGVAINNSTINLGGEGGRVPGAGGGGGGAIGEGSRGGDGGGGGGITRELIDMTELMEAGFDHAEVKVGVGGMGQALSGQHAKDGETSIINFLDQIGTVIKSVRAEGGKGGRSAASYLPEGVSEISKNDIDEGFRVTTLMPVNSAEIRNGLLFVLGGGWEHFDVPTVPINAIWNVVVIARWQADYAEPKGIFLSLIDSLGMETSCVALHIPIETIPAKIGLWVCPIGATLDAEGVWKLRLHSGNTLILEYPVRVMVGK
jgi:hypothetical protein